MTELGRATITRRRPTGERAPKAASTTRRVALAGAASLAATACLGSQPQRAPRTIPHSDVNPWGTNTFLHKEVEDWKKQRTFKMIREAGIGWIKQQFPWEELEQPRKGQFYDTKFNQSTWDKFDAIVKLAEEHAVRVIARLDRPPGWARADKTNPERPPENFDDYADFVQAVAARYKGRVNHFQVWNEPNLGEEWTGKPDPAEYVRLLKTTYTKLKQANPEAVVLSAPLAINNEMGPIHLNEIDFLDQMYMAGAKPFFDVLSANAYGMDKPPADAPSRNTLNFRRVELLRQVMEKHGDANKAVWFNEYAWNASPREMPKEELTWQRVSEQQQADWTLEGVQKALKDWPWAGVFCTWYFRQVGDIPPSKSEYYFRLVDPDFTPRPVYNAIRRAATGK